MTETEASESTCLPPAVVPCRQGELDYLLSKEWLLSNDIGAYASSTVVGCNVRRYHGLLVAAAAPPAQRIVTLSTVMEQLTLGRKTYYLGTNEFAEAFSPRGVVHLLEFRNDIAATFVFRIGETQLIKEIILAEADNAVAVRYTLIGASAKLRLCPFIALRDYHHLRKVHRADEMTFQATDSGVAVQDRTKAGHTVHLTGSEGTFHPAPQWWYRFYYRNEVARGQDGFEDLYTPGYFDYQLGDSQSCQFTASLDEPLSVAFEATVRQRGARLISLAQAAGPEADETTRRLAAASETFTARRSFPNASASATILAGFHWFADWGRDAFVALPGLLLATRQFDRAREVFRTFAGHLANGLIPNNFDEQSSTAHYNSIDASLWFIIAAERYLAATDETTFWRRTLMPAANAILTAYREGTRFDIHADADGLLSGGAADTQLTWMDAAWDQEPITPRHGKAVEVNALWHSAHRIMARRCEGIDDDLARHYAELAELIEPAFVRTFWNPSAGCLYDCVAETTPDASIRPNQIFAVSLPYSPLPPVQQAAVVRVVEDKLLTPFGLRTLSPDDSRYRGRYGGSWESRDRAYHQGTAWAWLMGPFIEAYLKVEGPKPSALAQASKWLEAFEAHLEEAGMGYISEIFDGDPPHTPRGCIGQAWSVAEILRAKKLIAEYPKGR